MDCLTKTVDDRYARASRYWGIIAVHPADLVEKYREIFTERKGFLSHSAGGEFTRTTALAHAAKAVDGLKSNGYKKGEIAVILGILAND